MEISTTNQCGNEAHQGKAIESYGMDSVMHPDRRKWISKPLILRNYCHKLRFLTAKAGLYGDLRGSESMTTCLSIADSTYNSTPPDLTSTAELSISQALFQEIGGAEYFNMKKKKNGKRGRRPKNHQEVEETETDIEIWRGAMETDDSVEPVQLQPFEEFMKRAYVLKMEKERVRVLNYKRNILQDLNMTEEEFYKLQTKTSLVLITALGETYQDQSVVLQRPMPILVPPILKIETVLWRSISVFITHSEDPTGFQWRSNNVQQQINDDISSDYCQAQMDLQTEDYRNGNPDALKKANEMIIEVSYYLGGHPNETIANEIKMHSEPKLCYKLQILGSNTVADLMKALQCENDALATKDVKHPDCKFNFEKITKSNCRSSMAMIGNLIFSDSRSIKYCDKINEWINLQPEKDLGPFHQSSVKTQLQDIPLRFGYPCLFVHQGVCEHVIVFNTARLMVKEDEHRRSRYPRISSNANFNNSICRVDNEHLATWAVVDFEEFPESPMMLCTDCVKAFCYTSKGHKRGEFKLYPFRQLANEI